ncbi:hypothetical protein KP806_24210, partial [Paenibacillus sp. N4]|uniref:hypothetical protein n=1 Tax=Paenibacillus vietnamensis TaxID=2590547 RepID=UPI001CD0759E
VLGTPPAFVLSQDQTLHKKFVTHFVTSYLTYRSMFSFQGTIILFASAFFSAARSIITYIFLEKQQLILKKF